MDSSEVKAGMKVMMSDRRLGTVIKQGTGVVIGFEPMKNSRGETYQGERVMVKIDEGTYHNPCLTDGIGCWFPNALSIVATGGL